MKSEIEAKIEYWEVIGEANPGAYQPVRFSRVKYKASPDAHIDIRRFQRAYDDEGEEVYHPTKLGFQFLEREFRRVVKDYAVMPETYVHPLIVKRSFKLLNDAQFESAVLQAFKTIETKIREKINAGPEDIGVKLIRPDGHFMQRRGRLLTNLCRCPNARLSGTTWLEHSATTRTPARIGTWTWTSSRLSVESS